MSLIKENITEREYKTSVQLHSIDGAINDDIIVYLFIQKENNTGSWHLIVPIIIEKYSGKTFLFEVGQYALQGTGGGLGGTKSLLHKVKEHKEKGFRVAIVPKVIENNKIDEFYYFDSSLTIQDLINGSVDLINYQRGVFSSIYKQYDELIKKYEL